MANTMNYTPATRPASTQVKPEIAGNKTIFVEVVLPGKMVPPSNFTNEARGPTNAYNAFKQNK